MELFLHPWYMVAGGALISSPIIIHLINRMRFKRIRWAAMEFLLKSQKRNRRRLIIEQMILLLLRILLVLLAAFLVARYVMSATATGGGTTHVLILDNTPSMGDHWAGASGPMNAFEQAKIEIKKMAKQAALANSEQHLRVMLLSDLDTLIFDERLNDRSIDDLERKLRQEEKPTAVHIDPVVAIERAESMLLNAPQKQKVLHFVGDFRERDWVDGPGVEKLNQAIDRLLEKGINLSLIDAAHPFRKETGDVAIAHDNLAITDLRVSSRVAAEGEPVEFTATVHNYGTGEKKSFLHVKVGGKATDDFEASKPIDNLPPGQDKEIRFEHRFRMENKGGGAAAGDPAERDRRRLAEREFIQVSVALDPEETGLQIDNARDIVVEVRKRVPVLIVDGGGKESQESGGDTFHLESALLSVRSYEVERRTVEELDKLNLDMYPTIYFLNVPEIKNEKTLTKLKDYVQNKGGGICFFMGDKVKPVHYNEVLHKEYEGLFPVLIAGKPYNSIDPDGKATEEDKADARQARRQKDEQPKLLFRHPTHQVVELLHKSRTALRFLLIEQYYKTLPSTRWVGDPNLYTTIVTLPNQSSGSYGGAADELGRRAFELTKELVDEQKDEKEKKKVEILVPVVKKYSDNIHQAVQKQFPFELVRLLDSLLNDIGIQDNPDRPNMPELWQYQKMRILAKEIHDLKETILWGDPLVVARTHGLEGKSGRTVAVLTTAGTSSNWNDWAAGNPSSWSYVPFVMELQRFLISPGAEFNRVVGTPLTQKFDSTFYLAEVESKFYPQPDLDKQGGAEGKQEGVKSTTLTMPLNKNFYDFDYTNTTRPGVYSFEFQPQPVGAEKPANEVQSYAFNVDAVAESDLRRAAKEKLERNKPGASSSIGRIALRSPGDDYATFQNKQPDASESPWLYLFILLILIVEQALAVHLSFHLKGSEALPAAAGTARPQPVAA
jgi:hypothetical protein